jgi:DNA-binding transcriptional regulator LsrR (DeoR family)
MMRIEKPYSVLYAHEGEIYKCGPFLNYNETMDYIRKHATGDMNREFDLDEEYVYIMTPDHCLISVSLDDLDAPPVEE